MKRLFQTLPNRTSFTGQMARWPQMAADHRHRTPRIGGKHAEPWRTRVWCKGQRSWRIPQRFSQRFPWWKQPRRKRTSRRKSRRKRWCSEEELQPGFWLLNLTHVLARDFLFQPWWLGLSISFSTCIWGISHCPSLEICFPKPCLEKTSQLIALQLCI